MIGERTLRQILTSWDRLQRLLRETIDEAHYHLGHTFERVEQDGSGVRVHFAEGRIERADLLIGGDGIRSGVRAQVAPDVQPIYSGYYIWRGAPNEADLAPETLASIFPYFTFFLPERQQVIGYPICGLQQRPAARPSPLQFHLVPRRRRARRSRKCASTSTASQHEFSVPPPLIRKDLIAQMRAEAESHHAAGLSRLPAQHRAAVLHADLRFLRAAASCSAASRWSATPPPSSRPHMGFGVAKAGGDAQALADALREP